MTPRRRPGGIWLAALCLAFFGLTGCSDMHYQPKFRPQDPSPFFSDGRSARQPPADTVALDDLKNDPLLYTGKIDGKPANVFPYPVTRAMLDRGHERFDIYCSVCHGRSGDGQGMVVKRGFPVPPSYHIERLRNAPAGYFFDVMTNGFGVMYPYGDRIGVEDRWAIVAYIRALQRSQNARLSDATDAGRRELEQNR